MGKYGPEKTPSLDSFHAVCIALLNQLQNDFYEKTRNAVLSKFLVKVDKQQPMQ